MAQTKCVVCGRTACAGIKLGSGYICAACERKILNTRAGTGEYDAFVHAMRRLNIPRAELSAAQAEALERELNMSEKLTVDELLARVGLIPARPPKGGLRCAERPVWQRAEPENDSSGRKR